MWTPLVLTVLLCTGISWAADAEMQPITPYIMGGVATVEGAFPSIVSIQTPAQVHRCGGVLVDQRHIVTSAQCVLQNNVLVNPFWMQVIAGDRNIATPSYRRQTRNVTRIFVSPQYNPVTRANDIAVIRVDLPFPAPHNTIEAAVRRTRIVPVGTACFVAGWGTATAAGQLLDPVQKQGAINILDRSVCTPAHPTVAETAICARGTTAQICNGSTGSGLFCNGELTGILSFGVTCVAPANVPGVFTQIRFFNEFIEQQFMRTDNPAPGSSPFPNPPPATQ